MNQFGNNLTQDELLHLAVEATKRGEHGAAISYLKEGVDRFPSDGKLAYVLGAEFAQIGLYDKAEAEMMRAIELAPELHTACFQLGLLQMTLGKVEQSKLTWKGLDALPTENALQLFRFGIERLAGNEYDEALNLLKEGIRVNDFSPELNTDMENVIKSIPSSGVIANSEDSKNDMGHVWLSAYNSEAPN